MTGHVKVAGVWKDMSAGSVKVGGVWKNLDSGWTKIGGTWKQWYSSSITYAFDYIKIGGAGSSWGGVASTATYGGTGAGGYQSGSSTFATGNTISITVGAAGALGGNSGTATSVTINSSELGGAVASPSLGQPTGVSGSSQGGGFYFNDFDFFGTYWTANNASQGNKGGDGIMYNDVYPGWAGKSGGGGGAGAAGSGSLASGATNVPNGGAGISSSITGTAVFRAAGGGGGGYRDFVFNSPNGLTVSNRGLGGSSIGGNGAQHNNTAYTGTGTAATNGLVNTGSGGGGPANGMSGGLGASGVFILRYADTLPDLTSIGAGLVYTRTTYTGYKVYTFTGGTGTVTV